MKQTVFLSFCISKDRRNGREGDFRKKCLVLQGQSRLVPEYRICSWLNSAKRLS